VKNQRFFNTLLLIRHLSEFGHQADLLCFCFLSANMTLVPGGPPQSPRSISASPMAVSQARRRPIVTMRHRCGRSHSNLKEVTPLSPGPCGRANSAMTQGGQCRSRYVAGPGEVRLEAIPVNASRVALSCHLTYLTVSLSNTPEKAFESSRLILSPS
jgi:hypothetical protein